MFHGSTFLSGRKHGSPPPWTPAVLSSSNLKFWVRPESVKYQDSARSTLVTTTGQPIGSWTDESGNNNHATQVTGGSRPARSAGGGVTFAGNFMVSTNVMGTAMAGDFVYGVAAKVTTSVVSARYLDCGSINGYILSQANNTAAPNLVNSIVNDASPPYGIEVSCTDNVLHTFKDSRVGSTHDLYIDGVLAGTETVSTGALGAGSYLCISAATTGGTYSMYGDIYEIIVIASPSAGDLTGLSTYLASRVTAGVYY